MIIQGDCRDVLPTLEAGSVQCVVTSPPYWGLRDYGVERQIGLEPTPEAFIDTLVGVFREVRRVLRDDGTVWLNMGDSYATTGAAVHHKQGDAFVDRGQRKGYDPGSNFANYGDRMGSAGRTAVAGLKPKDLCLIPFRLALALQADGWYVRSDIIWAKGLSFCDTYAGSVMPESCTDRPTTSHEHVFLLTKSPRYYYDAEAVREASSPNSHPRGDGVNPKATTPGRGVKQNTSFSAAVNELVSSRNLRTVWAINPAAFSAAHFATYPMALVEPCIKAGSSQKGQCSACGTPWRRVVEKERAPDRPGRVQGRNGDVERHGSDGRDGDRRSLSTQTTGWAAQCECDAPTEPQTVLDPFAGSGTTGIVAARLGREFVGIELNQEYATMADEGIHGPLFAGVTSWVTT